jgi:hypothetical protein
MEEGSRGVCNRKREKQGSLEPEEGRTGEYATGRGKNRKVWNRKREDRGSVELNETVQGFLQKIL